MAAVLIIGGGIAGAASAIALHKAGIEVTVYEAHPRSSLDAGAFLTLASNGMRALRQIDADALVAQAGSALTTMRICNGEGIEIATVPIGDHEYPATRYRYLTRATLRAVLQQEAQRRGIRIHRGKQLIRVATHDRDLTAFFSDQTQARGDVLIGADGLHSTVRTLIDPATAAPRYVGQRIFYGYSTDTTVRSDPDHFHVIRGTTAFGYIVTRNEGTWWFARVHDDELDRDGLRSGTTQQWKSALSALLQHEQSPAPSIVNATHRILVTNAYDLPDVAAWHRDGMLIIGDAAHAASPATGQGASMALEDAVILAKALRDQPDVEHAFTKYEQLRRERVHANINASARLSARRDLAQQSAPSPRTATPSDDTINTQLEWNTTLE
ncbi:MAG: FAD-dependent oxidoreductase [Pseudonocardiaceae bacterium]